MKSQHSQHIVLNKDENGRVTIDIDDWELFDFIDDYLTEQFDIAFNYMKECVKDDGSKVYRMYFEPNFTLEQIDKAINNIDNQEITSIRKLNKK